MAVVTKNLLAKAGDAGDAGSNPWVGKIPWRSKWYSSVFLPGESHGQRSMAGYSPRVHKESDITEQLTLNTNIYPKSCICNI